MPQQRYEEVANDFRRKIESGEYPPGSRLPSRAELRNLYGISDKALLILRQAGLVETLPGVGVFVAGTRSDLGGQPSLQRRFGAKISR